MFHDGIFPGLGKDKTNTFGTKIIQRLPRLLGSARQQAEKLRLAAPQIDASELSVTENLADTLENAMQKYADSVIQCQVLEDMTDEQATQDVHSQTECELSEQSDDVIIEIRSLRSWSLNVTPSTGRSQPAAVQQTQKTFQISSLNPLPQDSTVKHFCDWRKTWNNNAMMPRLNSFQREVQVYALVTALGSHASQIVEVHCGIDLKAPRTTVELILDKLQTYFRAQRNIAVDRVNFHQRK
ncbi:hypothetical protein SNE40_019921 [Patella caerulea]|uniref:Uncharacterized protein n=1 Tax=Patella caerulea TaxID=87958 RepID=A0AAN8G6J4_PATCE